MKTGVSSYSYSKAVKKGTIEYLDVIEKTAELGFDAIEFSGLPVKGQDERIKIAPL